MWDPPTLVVVVIGADVFEKNEPFDVAGHPEPIKFLFQTQPATPGRLPSKEEP